MAEETGQRPQGGSSGYQGSGGPRSSQGGRPGGGPGGPKRGKRNFVRKKKVCRFCVDKVDYIDYKKAEVLASFIQERGKILPPPHDGNLREAPALAHRGHQAGAEHRPAAVRRGAVAGFILKDVSGNAGRPVFAEKN